VPLRNRVTPLGDLVADPAHGLVYGNRGCLHDAQGRIRRTYATRRWIACRLRFRGRRRSPLMQPGRYTELFFLDEATALAAGHRPCAECRREDYRRFQGVWESLHPGPAGADAMDDVLHAERLDGSGGRRLHQVSMDELPDGAFVMWGSAPRMVLGDRLLAWTPAGYADPIPRPARSPADAITPPSLVDLLWTGWDGSVPLLHSTANQAVSGTVTRS
jgi:hypothetical protein